ncbi:MAG: 50S ribosomal protein L11 methyltransferase [Lachnospiraceae bacterium]|nr:50S ribosomal protein L11 methyltransferase [Lachnospiraceae bacterium]
MKWIRYTIETTTAAEDLVSSALADLGIEGVEIENQVPLSETDTAKMFIDIPPELPEDDGISRVSFYLDADSDHEEILSGVREALGELSGFTDVGSAEISVSETEDADWMNNWKEFFHAFTIEADEADGADGTGPEAGRAILIKPTWEDPTAADADKILIEIDPGISFGTGKHETTQLCIRQLMRYVREGDSVLDLGCGSGILSIAALKLGAAHVTGTDIDEDCLSSTRANFEINRLKKSLCDLYLGNLIEDEDLQRQLGTGQYDIVAANILAEVLIPMAPKVPACLKEGGVFIASGIIDFKEEEVKDAIEEAGLFVLEINHQGEWVAITARK